jgi:hypothetical protein
MDENPADPGHPPQEGLSARRHHYFFAHRGLPELLWQQSTPVLEALIGPEADAFLRDYWEHVGNQLEEAERLEPEGLTCRVCELADGYRAAVITLPPAERCPEAHLAAVVFRPPQRRTPTPKTEPVLRYFTLERGLDLLGEGPRTVLCEWKREGAHLNFGAGPEASVRSFADSLQRFLEP